MKTTLALLLVLVLCTTPTTRAHADTSPVKLLASARDLDENLARIPVKEALPKLAELLKVTTEQVEKALVEKKISFSRLAIFKLVADRTGTSLSSVLVNAGDDPLPVILQSASVSLDDAVDHLDNLYADVAFLKLDKRTPSKALAKSK